MYNIYSFYSFFAFFLFLFLGLIRCWRPYLFRSFFIGFRFVIIFLFLRILSIFSLLLIFDPFILNISLFRFFLFQFFIFLFLFLQSNFLSCCSLLIFLSLNSLGCSLLFLSNWGVIYFAVKFSSRRNQKSWWISTTKIPSTWRSMIQEAKLLSLDSLPFSFSFSLLL